MYYQYTGQPGHGKTVLALEMAMQMKAKADMLHEEDPSKHPLRELYVCNVRDFNHGNAGSIPLAPDELKRWCDHPDYVAQVDAFKLSPDYTRHGTASAREDALLAFLDTPELRSLANERINPAFENAIILVDEAYESGMFPRRPPGRPIPRHVERVAKHRHFGIDFIMICQSPARQMDDFLHDLIEEHYHVRRRYGLPFVNLKRWDRFERRPDKAQALTVTRRKYPTHIFKLYTSTKYDTSEKRIPWFYWAILAVLVIVLALLLYVKGRMADRFGEPHAKAAPAASAEAGAGDGAPATAPGLAGAFGGNPAHLGLVDYETAQQPRNVLKPWSAPIFDDRQVKAEPALYCMSSSAGEGADGNLAKSSCSCVTEQGTPYRIALEHCLYVARWGQPYNPYREPKQEQEASSSPGVATTDHQASSPGAVVNYRPGSRGDTFPLNPARAASTWTPPTTTL